MKAKTSILLFTLSILLGSVSCSHAQDPDKISEDKLIADLETLKFWIEEAHGDPYRFSNKEDVQLQFKNSRQRVEENDGLTLEDFFQETMRIVALLKDGHSQAFMPELDTINGRVFFPILIRFIDYKPYVLHALNPDTDIAVGSEIVSINGRASGELFSELADYVHGDGNIRLSKYRKLESNFYLTRLFSVFGVSDGSYQITVRKVEGKTEKFTIDALTQSEASSEIRNFHSRFPKKKVFDLNIIENDEPLAVLTIGSFNTSLFQDDYTLYKKTIDDYFNTIHEADVENLVVDLRNNTGGEDSYEAYLLRYLMNEPFEMYGQLTFRKNDYKFLPDGKHWDIPSSGYRENSMGTYDATEALWEDSPHTLGTHYPLENRFKGKLILLINARTFSAASGMASFLHYSKRATIIGEETAGSYIGSVAGYNPTFDLPNTRINITVPLMNVRRPFFEEAWTDRGVIPDIQVEPTIMDLINGYDSVKEAAINFIKSK